MVVGKKKKQGKDCRLYIYAKTRMKMICREGTSSHLLWNQGSHRFWKNERMISSPEQVVEVSVGWKMKPYGI